MDDLRIIPEGFTLVSPPIGIELGKSESSIAKAIGIAVATALERFERQVNTWREWGTRPLFLDTYGKVMKAMEFGNTVSVAFTDEGIKEVGGKGQLSPEALGVVKKLIRINEAGLLDYGHEWIGASDLVKMLRNLDAELIDKGR